MAKTQQDLCQEALTFFKYDDVHIHQNSTNEPAFFYLFIKGAFKGDWPSKEPQAKDKQDRERMACEEAVFQVRRLAQDRCVVIFWPKPVSDQDPFWSIPQNLVFPSETQVADPITFNKVTFADLDRLLTTEKSAISRIVRSGPLFRDESNPTVREDLLLPFFDPESMLQFLCAKDDYTFEHCWRARYFVSKIIDRMPVDLFSDNDRKSIELAALLHDIGKIVAPDELLQLRKRKGLYPREQYWVNRHANIGLALMALASYPTSLHLYLLPIICHHLSPRSIEEIAHAYFADPVTQAADINLFRCATTILKIADALDAMTSRRPYNDKPRTVQQAAEMLRRDLDRTDPDDPRLYPLPPGPEGREFAEIIKKWLTEKQNDILSTVLQFPVPLFNEEFNGAKLPSRIPPLP